MENLPVTAEPARMYSLMAEAVELGRMAASLRLDFEREIGQKSEDISPLAKFLPGWYETIVNIAARGMTSCPLPLRIPNPDKLPLPQIRPVIAQGVREFFSSTDFRILQFNDWRVVREFGPENPDGSEPTTRSFVEVFIMISWKGILESSA